MNDNERRFAASRATAAQAIFDAGMILRALLGPSTISELR